MTDELVLWEAADGVGRITLNRPETLNAWTAEFGRQLKEIVTERAAEPSIRAVLVTGAGRGFSSGADLRAGFEQHPDDGGPDVRKELHEIYHPVIAGVRRLEKPVVAAVNGPAVGIGCSLALACDLVLAAESSFFGLAFVNIGLMPDGGSTLFVPVAVGKARAFQMALLGERVTAECALEWGLVNAVHPDAELEARADELVARLATGPTRSYAGSKRALNQMIYPDLDGQLDARGGATARARPHAGLRRGRRSLRREARSGLPRRLSKRPAAGRRPDVMILPPLRPGASHLRRRALVVAVIGALAALLVLAPAAFAGFITPESGGSPNADKISTLYKITLAIGVVIFLLVEGILLYSLFKYRFRRSAPSPAQIRGNTPLEMGWTIGAAAILVVLAVVTFIYLGEIEDPPASGAEGLQAAEGVEFASIDQPEPPGGSPLTIDVNSQQYLWRFDYPNVGDQQLFTYYEMVVPVDTTVTLDITSQDVNHSWWIPELGGKADAIPGHTNETWFKISEPGIYNGVCAELCGENHADMRARVRAMEVPEYEAWVEQQAEDITSAQELLAVERRQRERALEQ